MNCENNYHSVKTMVCITITGWEREANRSGALNVELLGIRSKKCLCIKGEKSYSREVVEFEKGKFDSQQHLMEEAPPFFA